MSLVKGALLVIFGIILLFGGILSLVFRDLFGPGTSEPFTLLEVFVLYLLPVVSIIVGILLLRKKDVKPVPFFKTTSVGRSLNVILIILGLLFVVYILYNFIKYSLG